jgi:hypothetical protein
LTERLLQFPLPFFELAVTGKASAVGRASASTHSRRSRSTASGSGCIRPYPRPAAPEAPRGRLGGRLRTSACPSVRPQVGGDPLGQHDQVARLLFTVDDEAAEPGSPSAAASFHFCSAERTRAPGSLMIEPSADRRSAVCCRSQSGFTDRPPRNDHGARAPPSEQRGPF